jgi:hypothetical protein
MEHRFGVRFVALFGESAASGKGRLDEGIRSVPCRDHHKSGERLL